MFYRKLKKRAIELETKLADLQKQVHEVKNQNIILQRENESLKWKIDHPQKYNIGDVFEHYIITDSTIKQTNMAEIIQNVVSVIVWGISLIYSRKNVKKIPNNPIKSKFDWHYEMVSKVNGKKMVISETELLTLPVSEIFKRTQ